MTHLYSESDVETAVRGSQGLWLDLCPDAEAERQLRADCQAWREMGRRGARLVWGRRSPGQAQVLDADSPTVYWPDGYVGTMGQYRPVALKHGAKDARSC